MKATMMAYDAILAGSNDVVVSGGMESMTNAPYLIPKARGGYRIGHGQIFDHMMLDGLKMPTTKVALWALSRRLLREIWFHT